MLLDISKNYSPLKNNVNGSMHQVDAYGEIGQDGEFIGNKQKLNRSNSSQIKMPAGFGKTPGYQPQAALNRSGATSARYA